MISNQRVPKKKLFIVIIFFLVLIIGFLSLKNSGILSDIKKKLGKALKGKATQVISNQSITVDKDEIVNTKVVASSEKIEVRTEIVDNEENSEDNSHQKKIVDEAVNESTNLDKIRNPFQKSWGKKVKTREEDKESNNDVQRINTDINDINTEESIGSEDNKIKGYTYQDLYNMIKKEDISEKDNTEDQATEKNDTDNDEAEEKIEVEDPIEYPPYNLKGVVIGKNIKKAVLAFQGRTYILNTGDIIDQWQIEDIDKNKVVLTDTEYRFIMTLEGVALDEE